MSGKIKVIFLGTSDAIPSSERNHSSILLNYKDENILIDCGEGTQRQFRIAKLNPCKITRILITHWHGDHILGIPGILQTLAFSNYNKTLFIYGPKGTKKFMKKILELFIFEGKLKIKVEEVSGKFLETEDFYIRAQKMTHGTPSNAYAFFKKGQIKIDKEKLKKAGISEGPHLKKLKDGKDISYKGKSYSKNKLTFIEEDKKISFVLDTSMNKRIVSFVQGSNLLICESTFGSEIKDKAKEYKHLTAKQAAEIAKKAKVEKLILTHVSQRYSKNMKKILDEAKNIFKNSRLAKDLDIIEI